jgi:hypothetical protein
VYTDAVLLPITKKAYREIQAELRLHDLQEVIDDQTTVGMLAGSFELDILSIADTSFLAPIEIWEKLSTEPDTSYKILPEKLSDPALLPAVPTLESWYYRQNKIIFGRQSSVQMTILIKFQRRLAAPTLVTSALEIMDCELFMSARVAAIAAYSIGGNEERSAVYQGDAFKWQEKLIQSAVKRKQANPTRRQPFRTQTQ